MNLKKLTSECVGTIKNSTSEGLDYPTIVSVEYTVGGEKYILKESLKLKSKAIKLGPLTIGRKQIPKIDAGIGKEVIIIYNPQKPDEAHIKGNDGNMNC